MKNWLPVGFLARYLDKKPMFFLKLQAISILNFIEISSTLVTNAQSLEFILLVRYYK